MKTLQFRPKRRPILLPVLIVLTIVSVGVYLGATQTRLLPAFWRIPTSPPAPAATRDDRWRQDLHYFAAQLPRLHVDPFHGISREAFEQAVADLDAAIPQLDDTSIALRIVQLTALLGDAHTEAVPPKSIVLRLYPVQLYWFKDGIYVINTQPDRREARFARVTGINGVPVEELAQRVAPLIAHDNVWGLKNESVQWMLSPEVFQALELAREVDPGRLSLETLGGRTQILTLAPVLLDEYTAVFSGTPPLPVTPLHLKNRGVAYEYEYLTESRTLYFRYNRCVEMAQRSFTAFNNDLFDFIGKNPVDRLVIDLRHNGGGNSGILSPFIERLSVHPLNQSGRLFVIIGRETFSSGVLNALELTQRTEAALVGEPTAGRPNHYGEVQMFTLPNSGMRVRYSTKYFAPGLFDLGRLSLGDMLGVMGYANPHFPYTQFGADSVEPEIVIAPTGAEYAAGRDPVLEYITQIAPLPRD